MIKKYKLINVETGEISLIKNSIKQWAETKQLNYYCVLGLLRNRIKIYENWKLDEIIENNKKETVSETQINNSLIEIKIQNITKENFTVKETEIITEQNLLTEKELNEQKINEFLKKTNGLWYDPNEVIHGEKIFYKGIYKIENIINDKFYYGSSINIKKRWWEHRKWLRLNQHSNKHLQNAWNLYGEKCFFFSIAEKMMDASEEEIKNKEQEYLDKYFDGGEICYNKAKVADRPDSDLAKHPVYQLDKDTREIIKEWPSAADIERETGWLAGCIGNACKGILITYMGFRWKYIDPERAIKFKEKEGQHGGHSKRKIVKIDSITSELLEEYGSLEEAAQKNGIKKYTSVLSVAAGRRNHVNQMVFRYKEDYEKLCEKLLESNNINENYAITDEDKKLLTTCRICSLKHNNLLSLSAHLQYFHKIKSEDYTIQYFFDNIRPKCLVEDCQEYGRYTTYDFKKYCKNHSHIAESEGGKLGQAIKKNNNSSKE